MENTTPKVLGKIIDSSDCLIHRTHIADGSINGKKFDCSIARYTNVPVITYEDKYFVISWNEIAELAYKAGLFNKTNGCKE